MLRFIKCITLCRYINRLNRCRFILVPIFAMSFGKFGLNDTMLSKKLYRPIGFNHAGWDVWVADHIIAILLATTASSLLYGNSAFYQSYPLGRYPVFPLQQNSVLIIQVQVYCQLFAQRRWQHKDCNCSSDAFATTCCHSGTTQETCVVCLACTVQTATF